MADISDLTLQNPWWKSPESIKRDEKIIESFGKEREVIYTFDDDGNYIIFGPRQVGKTTYIKQLIYDLIINKGVNPRDVMYFSCDPLEDKGDLLEVMRLYFQIGGKGKHHIFLDEITGLKGWEYALKYFIENDRNGVYYVSGSNARYLKRGYERLPGRNIRIRLFHPLSFRRYLLYFGSPELAGELKKTALSGIGFKKEVAFFADEIYGHFQTYLKTGGFLRAIYEYNEKGRISDETKKIYINWALGDIGKAGKSVNIFKRIVRGIVERYGTKFSLNSIAKAADVGSHKTVGAYLELMEEFMLIKQLFSVDINEYVPNYRKMRKAYFIDPFLADAFCEWSTGKPWSDDNIGALVEGIVCEHLSRLGDYTDSENYLWFFISKKKKEVDFVLKSDKVYGIEVKWQNRAVKSDFSEPTLFKNRIILSKKDLDIDAGIYPVPLFLALLDV